MSTGAILLVGCGILILAFGLYVMYFSVTGNTSEMTFSLLFIGGGVCIAASVVSFKAALRKDANLIYP